MAGPPLPPLVVTRKPGRRLFAGMWVVSALPWIAVAFAEGTLGYVVVAVVWTSIAGVGVADLPSRATVTDRLLVVERFRRRREVDLDGAFVRARRREITVLTEAGEVILRIYPDRDQAAIGKDPRPIPPGEISAALLARFE